MYSEHMLTSAAQGLVMAQHGHPQAESPALCPLPGSPRIPAGDPAQKRLRTCPEEIPRQEACRAPTWRGGGFSCDHIRCTSLRFSCTQGLVTSCPPPPGQRRDPGVQLSTPSLRAQVGGSSLPASRSCSPRPRLPAGDPFSPTPRGTQRGTQASGASIIRARPLLASTHLPVGICARALAHLLPRPRRPGCRFSPANALGN